MGMFWESVRIALHALYANKLRSILTMLGIIIGVGAVITMVSVGMGVRQRVTDSIASLGSNMLIIRPGASVSGGLRGAAGSRTTLKYDDALAIKKKIKDVQYQRAGRGAGVPDDSRPENLARLLYYRKRPGRTQSGGDHRNDRVR